MSGEEDGGIGLKAYQVSNSAVAMEEARLIAATTDPSQMLVRSVDGEDKESNDGPSMFLKYFTNSKMNMELKFKRQLIHFSLLNICWSHYLKEFLYIQIQCSSHLYHFLVHFCIPV